MNDEIDPPRPEPVGSLADETGKLLSALGDWAREHGTDLGSGVAAAANQAAETARQVGEHVDTGAAECTFCPICRTVHAVRRTNPEVRAQLATAATALLQAGTGLLASLSAESGSGRSTASPGSSMERIDLDDDADDDIVDMNDTDDSSTDWEA